MTEYYGVRRKNGIYTLDPECYSTSLMQDIDEALEDFRRLEEAQLFKIESLSPEEQARLVIENKKFKNRISIFKQRLLMNWIRPIKWYFEALWCTIRTGQCDRCEYDG